MYYNDFIVLAVFIYHIYLSKCEMYACILGASTDVTARGVNALATWMIDHPIDDGSEEMSPAGGVPSPSELPTPTQSRDASSY